MGPDERELMEATHTPSKSEKSEEAPAAKDERKSGVSVAAEIWRKIKRG